MSVGASVGPTRRVAPATRAGGVARAFSGFDRDMVGSSHLQVTVPAYEAWLFKNTEAVAAVKKGLVESAQGRTRSRGSFARYADDES